MALLQIAEPGQSAAPHQHKLAVGIDLGTTNSLVAAVRSGSSEVLRDEQDRLLIPSIVHLTEDQAIVGYEAGQLASQDPQNTIISVKRLIGRSCTDVQQRYPNLPYQFNATENGLPLLKTRRGLLSPVEISAEILKKLTALAEQRLGGELTGAVITVPAYFDDAQRQSTKDAAKLAGLKVLRLLNEPTAAAIAYGGDTTRIPYVREQVGEFFQCTPLTSIDPDKVVALGAAIQADILVGNKPDSEMLLLDVIPLSLGIETMGGLVEKIIPRNTTIPVARAQEFTTFKDGQTAMSVHVLQGEREMVTDCRSLARFTLRGIPAMVAGAARIRVTYQVDADGLLSVTAVEKSTGVQASTQVKPSYGLTDDEIAHMLKSSMEHAKEDIQTRLLTEQRVDATRVIESVYSALQQDEDLLDDNELSAVKNALVSLQKLIQEEDSLAIKQGIKMLDQATQEFASRRMDKSIRRALSGQHIEHIK
ncbi:molecular chaperone HscA [Histophilus somni]|uniref:molecular chaperone HscA n=1 Tax=Histophilus somni TaxID=731 RepID=UPI00094AC496|nr:molecular chaperone HscA [Histophilus somni]